MRPAAFAVLALTLLGAVLTAGCYEDPDSTFPDRQVQDDTTWTERQATYGQVEVHKGSTLRVIRSHVVVEEDLVVDGTLQLIDSLVTFRRTDTNNAFVVRGTVQAAGSTVEGADQTQLQSGRLQWTGGSFDSEQLRSEGDATAWFEGVDVRAGNAPENTGAGGAAIDLAGGEWTISNGTLNQGITAHAEGGRLRLVDTTALEADPLAAGGANGDVAEADWVTVHLVDLRGQDVANRTVASVDAASGERESSAVTDADGEALLAIVHRTWTRGLAEPRDPHRFTIEGTPWSQPYLAQARLDRVEVVVPEA